MDVGSEHLRRGSLAEEVESDESSQSSTELDSRQPNKSVEMLIMNSTEEKRHELTFPAKPDQKKAPDVSMVQTDFST